ncbi:merozoite surface protein 3b [Massilia sp. BJB1822]|uniref:merozoite surface protein 3b n=1 Tax=Massilia sp. BJB1822 TaxID=2744470 RepID=UPI0015934B94|nr:merozoite surface protein 3b [Massilia sp. BJB1822]
MSNISYLDRAVSALRAVGINLGNREPAAVLPLLEKIAKYDNARVMAIATTLQYSSTFNAAVREQIEGMDISTRYADITSSFNSIREDAEQMSAWMADGRLDFQERIQAGWMKMRRGSIPDRFNAIRAAYLQVAEAANQQIQRETTILEAYRDFRMALKTAEVDAQEVLALATQTLEQRKAALDAAGKACEAGSSDNAERARLELQRDEALRAVQDEDKSYQIVKDIADDLKASYNTAEVVFARLQQTHGLKERLYQRAVTFFATNEVVFTGLAASFTSMAGLAETTQTMDAMAEGINQGLEALARTGTTQLEAGLRAGYGSTLHASSVSALANAVVEFQASSMNLIEELRRESTQTAQEIEAAAENGRQRFAALLVQRG